MLLLLFFVFLFCYPLVLFVLLVHLATVSVVNVVNAFAAVAVTEFAVMIFMSLV